MLSRLLRGRSMKSALEQRNTVVDHLPLSLVALQQIHLVALVVTRHALARPRAFQQTACARCQAIRGGGGDRSARGARRGAPS